MIKCVVVDDEQLARRLLLSYVEKLPNLECVGEAKNAIEAMDIVTSKNVDLIFLDIQMPDLSGLDLMKALPNPPKVIFTTAYKEFAFEGFDLNAVDYLLKPIAFDRFVKAVNKIPTEPIVQSPANQKKSSESITVKSDHRLHKLKLEEIDYIEGLREYVAIHTREGKIVSLMSLKGLEDDLPSDQFMRVHKSFIVNLKNLQTIHGNTIEFNGVSIPIGKTYKAAVLERF